LDITFSEVQKKLGYTFSEPALLDVALTHKSFRHLNGLSYDNEKLEFLGDVVLALVVSETLMKALPDVDEGHLTKRRASLVNQSVLAAVAEEQGFVDHLRVQQDGFQSSKRIEACMVEAILGAIYLDGGLAPCRSVVEKWLSNRISDASHEPFEEDFKSRLQEIVQKQHKMPPTYRLVAETGPQHDRLFEVELALPEGGVFRGVGKSKKKAEHEAAQAALREQAVKKEAK